MVGWRGLYKGKYDRTRWKVWLMVTSLRGAVYRFDIYTRDMANSRVAGREKI
jgi:hypothetical protein